MKKLTSLKIFLTTNFILMGIIPVLVVGLSALFFLKSSTSEEILKRNHNLAQSVAGEVETFLNEPLSQLKQIDEVILSSSILEADHINGYLETVISSFPFFATIQHISSDGTVRYTAPYNAELIGNDMSLHSFFRETMERRETTWSPTFISIQTGNPTISLSIPSVKNGIWVGYIDLETLSRIIGRVSDEHAYAVITDQEGTIIADIRKQRVDMRVNLGSLMTSSTDYSGNHGIYTEDAGEKLILSMVEVPFTGWHIMYFQHYHDAFAPVIKIQQMLIVGVILTLLLAVITAVFLARSILRPLSQLLANAKRIAGGNYDPRPTQQHFSEFQKLDQNFIAMAGAIKDRQKSLAESERQHRQLVETIPYGIMEVDLYGKIIFTNTANNFIFEDELGKMVGTYVWEKASSAESETTFKSYFFQLVDEEPEPTLYYAQAQTDSGNIIDIQIDWQYKRNPDGKLVGFIFVITDITEKKLLEENLRQAQKMEAIGTLAGGIAHDFNNILAAILGYSELVLDNLPEGSEDESNLQQVLIACQRARDLVQHLLLFSRKQTHEKKPVKPYLIVREALELMRATLPTTITFAKNLNKDAGTIEANSTQIHQVIINLCTNAAHAMEQGGILSVSLESAVVTADSDKAREISPGKYIKLMISDTGEGIEPENLKRIFEPFFTTKDVGKGTGMGLAVVHGIVESHGGHIFVDSTPGSGTQFELYFPDIEKKELTENSSRIFYRGNGEHILIVDDEKAIVKSTSQTLQQLGYSITATTDSKKALDLFKENPEAFDLVLTDQTMPELTGLELAKRILEYKPDIPVILCTGYSSTISAEIAEAEGIRGFVMKPLSKQTLSQKIAEILSRKHVIS